MKKGDYVLIGLFEMITQMPIIVSVQSFPQQSEEGDFALIQITSKYLILKTIGDFQLTDSLMFRFIMKTTELRYYNLFCNFVSFSQNF